MTNELIVLLLSRLSYGEDFVIKKDVHLEHKDLKKDLKILGIKDEEGPLLNGLQSAAFLDEDTKTIYIVSRGADIGIGKKLFKFFGASSRFLPKSSSKNEIKSFFQDWIYSATLAPMGYFRLYQYDSLIEFVKEIYTLNKGYKIIISGSSLGGLLSQLVYVRHRDLVDECITFSAMSPWYVLNKEERKELREKNFLKDDKNIRNYYSNYDTFRMYPLFPRFLGCHINVVLENFQTKTNVFATLLERLGWAHMTKYIRVDNDGNMAKEKEQLSKKQKNYNKLNEKNNYNTWINVLVTIINLVVFVLTYYGLTFILDFIDVSFVEKIVTIAKRYNVILPIFAGVLSLFYSFPSLLVTSNFKYIMIVLSPLTMINPFLWPWFLLLAIRLKKASD